MYSRKDITSDPTFEDFINSRHLRESSIKNHIVRMKSYCNFIGKLPSELIDEAEEEQESGIKSRKRKIKRYLISYVKHLENEGKSPSTMMGMTESIKAFYREYDVDVPRLKFPKTSQSIIYDELPTLKHVKTVLMKTNPRNKALILLHSSSGMGAHEVRYLKYKDLLNALKEYTENDDYLSPEELEKLIKKIENPIATWKIVRFKVNKPFTTFSSPESINAIIDYLKDRDLENKALTSENDYIFINRYGNLISSTYYSQIFANINDKHGFGRRNEKTRFFTSHSLRRFFATACYSSGLDKMAVDWMLGHTINGIDSAYFKAQPDLLKQKYLQALPKLTLDKIELRSFDSPEYKEMKKEFDVIKQSYEETQNQVRDQKRLIDQLIRLQKHNEKISQEI